MSRQFVREIAFRNQIIYVSHDKRYRYYIEVDGGYIKSGINAKECIEWLMDQMHNVSEPK